VCREVGKDLRPLAADITPGAIAIGVLNAVGAGGLRPASGDFAYLGPINGVRQVAATGFNYKKHIEAFDLWTKLNGQVEQQGNTSDMLFSVNEIQMVPVLEDDRNDTVFGPDPGKLLHELTLLSGHSRAIRSRMRGS
jgi:hypothetical protein